MRDFRHFNTRCREIFGHYEYITAAEPQGRGAWHLHCVFIFAGKAPYMENAVVRDCWKQGFVTVKRLDDVDNVGAYLTAYLGDMELSEASKADMAVSYSKGIKEVEYEDENGVKQTKNISRALGSVCTRLASIFFDGAKELKSLMFLLSSTKRQKKKPALAS